MALLDPAVDDAPEAVHDAPDTSGAPDVADDDGPDEEAMAAFLGIDTEDEGSHDAPDEAERVAGIQVTEDPDPAVQKKIRDLESGYTVKYQGLADARRAFEQERREFEAQKAAETVRGPQEPAAPAPAAGAKMKLSDCLDDEGYLDVAKLEQYESQREDALEQRILDTHFKPVTDKLTARDKLEQDQTLLAEETRLRGEFDRAKKAFPHFGGDEHVQMTVGEYMVKNNVRDFRAAYAACFPVQFAAAVTEYQQAVARKKQSGGQAPPATPPGRQARTNQALPAPEDEDARLDAMSRRTAQLTGVPMR